MKPLITLSLLLLNCTLLIAQDYALEQLENSPRHHEWVELTVGGRTLHSFVAYPEQSENSLAVIVIHENMGLNNWARSFADQIAAAGYIAIAPDLLSGANPDYPRTMDYPTGDAARNAIYQLDPAQITEDLNAVREYISNVPGASGQTVIAGFCWGGSQSFRYATNSDEIEAAFVFYGSPPENSDEYNRIDVPVYAFYAENDQRINASIPETENLMSANDNVYEYEIYSGAGHGFMRAGDNPDGSEANIEARNSAWQRLETYLSGIDQ